MRRLSDLEMAILGIVSKRGPCTSYTVTREFAASPSSHWRGSAGAVYPAMQRLQRLRLLKSKRGVRLGRPCIHYELSTKGIATLTKWLLPPLPESAAAITYDPIRTRVFFLAVLSPERQHAFLDEAERQSLAQLPILQAECDRYRISGDWFSEQAQQGALVLMEARLAWIRDLRERLGHRRGKQTSTRSKSC
jgi:DNA-binding PadR family transcriptional regulator